MEGAIAPGTVVLQTENRISITLQLSPSHPKLDITGNTGSTYLTDRMVRPMMMPEILARHALRPRRHKRRRHRGRKRRKQRRPYNRRPCTRGSSTQGRGG